MKFRLALTALVYAAALSIGALVVTGHLSLSPFSGNSRQVMALENEDSGSSVLLCYGCYQPVNTYRVTVTVTIQPTYNPCQWGCFQQPVYYHNPCQWGCYPHQTYNQNVCNWGGCRYAAGDSWANAQVCQWGCGGYTNTYTNWNTGCACQKYW